ncbi:MAG: hypothetical protein QOK28_2034 [Actinomycetota bacterium]|jgi:hypothetical protein
MKRLVQAVAVLWGLVGAAIALPAVGDASGTAKVVLLIASVTLPLCALVSAIAVERGRSRVGAILLIASCATPAYMAQLLAIAPLIAALVLLFSTRHTPETAAPAAG